MYNIVKNGLDRIYICIVMIKKGFICYILQQKGKLICFFYEFFINFLKFFKLIFFLGLDVYCLISCLKRNIKGVCLYILYILIRELLFFVKGNNLF